MLGCLHGGAAAADTLNACRTPGGGSQHGHKQLLALLENPALVAYVDAQTARVRPSDRLPGAVFQLHAEDPMPYPSIAQGSCHRTIPMRWQGSQCSSEERLWLVDLMAPDVFCTWNLRGWLCDSTCVCVLPAVNTWPALVDIYIAYVDQERAYAEERHNLNAFLESPSIGPGLRKLLQVADNEQRSGWSCQAHAFLHMRAAIMQ
eukprot:365630-Chlamydomonas_euryale.AAC.6